MNEGWICLHRRLLKKPIWLNSTPAHKTILITLLLMANSAENDWEWSCKKFKVKPGQFVTSLKSIKKNCGSGISIQQIRRAIDRFGKLEFSTSKATNQGRIITILNWEQYQSRLDTDRQANRQATDKRPTPNNKVTTKQINPPNPPGGKASALFDFYIETIAPARRSKKRAIKNITAYLKNEPYEKLEQAILNYKSTLKRSAPQFRKDPANFFGIVEPYAHDFYPESFKLPSKPECSTPDWL